MTPFEKQIKKAAEGYSLSDAEKTRMERVLKEYMRFKPVRGGRPAAAPYLSAFGWVAYLHRPMAAALVLVLVTSSTAAYAAESSLPGDALYTVKTHVTEPARVALASNAEAKAEIQMTIAERRIEEATTLSAEGRLDDSTQDSLAASFKTYAAAVSESIEKTAADDDSASLELAARFETRLLAHESILAEVDADAEENIEAGLKSHRLAEAIRETNEKIAEVRFSKNNTALDAAAAVEMNTSATGAADLSLSTATEPATMTMSIATEAPQQENARSAKIATPTAPNPTSTSAPDSRAVSRMQAAAERSLATAEKTLRKARSLSVEAKARADADITRAKDLIEEGADAHDDDQSADALDAFKESIRISEHATVYIKAAPSLEKARVRNSTRTRSPEPTSTKVFETSVEVSLPGATITASTSASGGSTTPDDSDRSANEDDATSSSEDAPEPKEPASKRFNIFQKLNISL